MHPTCGVGITRNDFFTFASFPSPIKMNIAKDYDSLILFDDIPTFLLDEGKERRILQIMNGDGKDKKVRVR